MKKGMKMYFWEVLKIWIFFTSFSEHWGFDIHRVSHQRLRVGVCCLELLHTEADSSTIQLHASQEERGITFMFNIIFAVFF